MLRVEHNTTEISFLNSTFVLLHAPRKNINTKSRYRKRAALIKSRREAESSNETACEQRPLVNYQETNRRFRP